ncbi:hypothetical protein [Fluviispira multicolorata]|uniref:Uncharacterized protein n=1 Tax=Fluviispira multicolorata TaxID=2654512 RepID=A0A833N883_9BACT|nr:hypothetical protein [Fluviispira multicolorata]KAB8033716.1 hypothetical protein GCL57_03140 [Fluviispira multicolorata]
MFHLNNLKYSSRIVSFHFKGFLLILFSLLCIACKSITLKEAESIESSYSLLPLEDKNYEPILSKWFRENYKYRDLELLFVSSATLLSPQMKNAYEKRLIETQGNNVKIDKNILNDSSTFGIIINHFTKNRVLLELNDQKLWTLQLNIDGKDYSPDSIIYYKNKDMLSSYFPDNNYWSRFYLVLFKLPPPILDKIESVNVRQKNDKNQSLPQIDDRTIVFTMNSGEMQMKFSWIH